MQGQIQGKPISTEIDSLHMKALTLKIEANMGYNLPIFSFVKIEAINAGLFHEVSCFCAMIARSFWPSTTLSFGLSRRFAACIPT